MEIKIIWKKYKYNPVLGDNKTGTLFDPHVMIDDKGLYRMYVSWRKNGNIALSSSRDGFNWSNLKMVLDKGNTQWEKIVNRASILYKDGIYHMWYTGQNSGNSKIGYAKSKDGYIFRQLNYPVLIPEYSYEKQSVMNPHVIFDQKEKLYKMWYAAGESYEPDVLGYATSKDGINWIKYKHNPILTPRKNKSFLDSFKVGGCDVHKISDNRYIMFFIGYSDINTGRIFLAESKDGINNWKRINNPIIEPTKSGFDSDSCYKPSAIYDKKYKKWMIYYNGRRKSAEYIGLALYNNYELIKS